jgi:hypothetical protein
MPQPAIFLVSNQGLLLWAALGSLAGVYWFSKGFSLLQRKRLILNTPASKIRSASMGLVEISGQATGPYVVTSPLQGRECYYYRSVGWELRERGKNREWVKLGEETLHVPFYLDDGTDKLLVDPRAAEMDLHCDLQEQYRASIFFEAAQISSRVRDFVVRHGADLSRQIKVEEYCIKPKNFLFVLGTLSQNPGIDAGIMPAWAERFDSPGKIEASEEPPRIKQIIRLSPPQGSVPLSAMTQQQKVAAALMKAGISSPAAWSAAGVSPLEARKPTQPANLVTTMAENEGKCASEREGFDLHPPVVLMKGTNQPAFYISWRSQREVVASLGWKSALMIWGGPILTLVCVYVLLAHFGRL